MPSRSDKIHAPVIPYPEPYAAPAELLGDRGLLFAFIMASCYGTVPAALLDKLQISRQTMWAWRQPGAGLPHDRIPDIERLIADPTEPFRLPTNACLEQIIRPLRGRASLASIRNQFLVDLLILIVSGHHLNLQGPYGAINVSTLDGIITTHMHGIRGPHIFWRWAYAGGGVPPSHIARFQRAMVDYGIPQILNMDEQAFDLWMTAHLVAPEGLSVTDDLD